jgi:hypothetical protein
MLAREQGRPIPEEEGFRVVEILEGAPVLVQGGHLPSTSAQGSS